jgi:hypothetical protein
VVSRLTEFVGVQGDMRRPWVAQAGGAVLANLAAIARSLQIARADCVCLGWTIGIGIRSRDGWRRDGSMPFLMPGREFRGRAQCFGVALTTNVRTSNVSGFWL